MSKEEKIRESLEENIFVPLDEMESGEKSYSYSELVALPGKELAKIAKKYCDYSLGTLEKKSKADLAEIVLSKGENLKKQNEAGRETRTKSDSEEMIETFLQILASFKVQRTGDVASTNNQVAEKVFKKSATDKLDEKIRDNKISTSSMSMGLMIVSAIYLLVDSFIGVDKIPQKIKELKARREAK